MKRRTFIHLSAYTAIALTLPLADGCALESTDKITSQPLLFSHLADVKSIKDAGNAYRKRFPAEDNKTTLTNLLLGSNSSKDKKTIQALLDNRVTDDFKTGKTVMPIGWVLSVTEARQCALFSILNA
jgi:hypothetical protein